MAHPLEDPTGSRYGYVLWWIVMVDKCVLIDREECPLLKISVDQ